MHDRAKEDEADEKGQTDVSLQRDFPANLASNWLQLAKNPVTSSSWSETM